MSSSLSVLLIAIPPEAVMTSFPLSPLGPFALVAVADAAAALKAQSATNFDAVLFQADRIPGAAALIEALSAVSALLVVSNRAHAELAIGWLRGGVQDVLNPGDLYSDALALRVRAAIERKRIERNARRAYATDLATGLPHQQQLIEHMSQLLALREREPGPMAVLVLRVEGFVTTEARLGAEAADALRRKVGVRLRAAVRASDVVAAIDDESYAVLLGSLLAASDAERVGEKLARALMDPFSVGGVAVGVAASVGIAQYPTDGTQPELLLRKALDTTFDQPASGRLGMANFEEAGGRPGNAANDE
jgi:diguanylate cyclase (GGDEF)-like protein